MQQIKCTDISDSIQKVGFNETIETIIRDPNHHHVSKLVRNAIDQEWFHGWPTPEQLTLKNLLNRLGYKEEK